MVKGKLIYIGSFKLPDGNAAAHRVINMAKAFKELGYEVVFLEIRKYGENADGSEKNRNLVKKDIWGFESWSVVYSNREYAVKVKDIIHLIKYYGNIKGIIAYNYPGVAVYRLKGYGAKYGVKIISDCTEWYDVPKNKGVFYLAKKADILFRMYFVNRNVDGLIVISKFLMDYYAKCKKVIQIPPLVDKTDKKWKQALKNESDKILFVYAGDLGNKDYMPAVIDGLYHYKSYNNFQLKIYGISYNDYIQRFSFQKQKLDELGDRVKFYGFIPHKQCIKEICLSDFVIFLRKKSRLNQAGFPVKFVEGISCKTPIITSDFSNIADYCKDTQGILMINEPFENNLTRLFEKIIVEGQYRGEHIRNSIDENLFDYRNYLAKIEKFLLQV